MLRGNLVLLLLAACYLALLGGLRAHTVESFYSSYERGSGVIVVNFDVAYAMPDVRDVENALQPKRDWLVSRSHKEHGKLREEAERYLRSYIHFESADGSIGFKVAFPDFKQSPYGFPELLDAGAYYNVELIPNFTQDQQVFVIVKEGDFPDLMIANKVDGELQFKTIQPTERSELINFISLPEENVAESENLESSVSLWQLLILGFEHVIPDGLDHVLFIIGMCLMASCIKQLLWQSLIFTLTHSLSMALVVSQLLPIYTYSISAYIESIIALSITFLVAEKLMMKPDFQWRCLIIAIFGFVHGLGFAGSLGSNLQFLSADNWVM